tara:strand:- start:2968 stop:3240 length:273 start_codon:yes stop_codon:yes gene_type:complete
LNHLDQIRTDELVKDSLLWEKRSQSPSNGRKMIDDTVLWQGVSIIQIIKDSIGAPKRIGLQVYETAYLTNIFVYHIDKLPNRVILSIYLE